MPEPTVADQASIQLLRHQLGSIDLSDLKDKVVDEAKVMSEAERRDYCAAIFAVWPRLEKDLKEFLHTQLMFISNNAESWDQVMIARGTFNGLDLVFQHWKSAVSEYEASVLEGKEERSEGN